MANDSCVSDVRTVGGRISFTVAGKWGRETRFGERSEVKFKTLLSWRCLQVTQKAVSRWQLTR